MQFERENHLIVGASELLCSACVEFYVTQTVQLSSSSAEIRILSQMSANVGRKEASAWLMTPHLNFDKQTRNTRTRDYDRQLTRNTHTSSSTTTTTKMWRTRKLLSININTHIVGVV